MILEIAIFAAGVVTGAFSHKWLEVEFTKETGVDPNAVAQDAKAAVQKIKPKV